MCCSRRSRPDKSRSGGTGGGRRLLEQGGKCGRTCHGSWGWRRQGGGCPRPSRQLSPDRGRERLTRPERAGKAAATDCRPRCRVPGESEKHGRGRPASCRTAPSSWAEGKRGKRREKVQERVTKSGGPARKLGGLRKSALNLDDWIVNHWPVADFAGRQAADRAS